MKFRALLAATVLVVLSALPTVASAAFVHYFNCENCHRSGAEWNAVGDATTGVCIGCHTTGGGTTNFNKQTTTGRPGDGAKQATLVDGFAAGDASNAFGSNPAAADQLSHNWAARDTLPAAGATAPTTSLYPLTDPVYGGASAARGFVACNTCHDPHTSFDLGNVGTEMLRTKTIGDGTDRATEANVEAMCNDCHNDWKNITGADHGLVSHPMVADYTTFQAANSTRYKPFVPATTNGEMKLLAGGAIGCTSCHGMHFTDSDASTPDGAGQTLNAGDGFMLRGDGAKSANDPTQTALCTSCHMYQTHPSSTGNEMGCLVCHSGHSYNDGNSNYYVLRDKVTVPAGANLASAGQEVSGLLYASATDKDANFATYCTGCHGSLTDTSPQGISANEDHSTGHAQCSLCHTHYDPASPDKSFAVGVGGCTGCHGTPPRVNTPGGPDGYAVNGGYNYAADPNTKNEANTAHATHALSGSNPVADTISCQTCHNAFSALHNEGSFQSVFVGGYPMATASAGGVLTTTAYDKTGAGTCSAVYCHSNGGAYNATGKVEADYKTTPATWEGATISGCSACHDDAASGIGQSGAAYKNNSPAHAKHIAAGYSCNVCHSATASNGSTIANKANHVNGSVELKFDTTYNLGAANLTGAATPNPASCSVYCHSNGASTFSLPKWDGTAACGSCHDVTGATLPAAHKRHLFDADGPMIGDCSVCHSHNGSGVDHVNGTIDTVDKTKCDTCHGSVPSGTGVDARPAWTDTSIGCDSCHRGTPSTINGRTAPTKDGFDNGHGKAGVARVCTDCHDAAGTTLHLDGINNNTNRLNGTLEVYNAADDRAFCGSCHSVATNAHVAPYDTVCQSCHAPHGEVGNTQDAMLKASVATGFVAQGVRTSYVNASFNGVCQSCHTNPLTKYFSTTKYENLTHNYNSGQACSDCHKHDATPAFAGAGTSCDACHGFPPKTGAHVKHAPYSDALDAAGTVDATADMSACAYCHTGADSYTYNPGIDQGNSLNHSNPGGRITILNNNVTSIGYDETNGTCSNACHQANSTRASWTGGFIFPDACDSCHGGAKTSLTTIASGSHGGHVSTATVDCDDCHGVIPADTAHIDVTTGTTELQKVQSRANALPDEANVTLAGFVDGTDTCSAVVCHNDGFNGTPLDAPAWGPAVDCSICHLSNMAGKGSHDVHLADGATCGTCHDSAVQNTTAPVDHADGDVDVYDASAGDLGYPVNAAYGNTSWASCSAASCHRAGQNATLASDYTTTPSWGTDAPKCSECHEASPTTNAHAKHIAVTGNCSTCHTTAIKDTSYASLEHRDLNVDVAVGGYPTNKALGSAVSSCTNISCHGDGLNPGGGNTPLWNASAGCGACHSAAPTSGSHTKHLADTGGSCTPCHDNANPATSTAPGQHGDGNIDVYDAVADTGGGFSDLGYPVNAAIGSASWSTCNAATCHDDGTGTLVTTPVWNTDSACNECHLEIPNTGAHIKHMTTTITTGITCSSCHNDTVQATSASTAGDHRDGNIDVYNTVADTGGGFSDLGYPANKTKGSAYSTCGTSYCHGDNMPRGTTSGSTNAPNWGGTSTGCNFCHDMAPTAISAHVGVVATDCVNCHGPGSGNVNATGTGFTDGGVTHIDHNLDGGGDNCLDCHGGLSARHAIHTDATTVLSGKMLSAGDYGNASWFYNYSVVNGAPVAACGQCHPSTAGTHMNGSKNIDLTPGSAPGGNIKTKNNTTVSYTQTPGVSVTCSSVYCHSDGASTLAYKTSPEWFSGNFTGDKCTNCHGNWPNTNAHESHQVGIHFGEIYAGSTGGLLGAPAATGNVDHGTTNLSTINCQTCHYGTVTTKYNDLATNSTANGCSSCHTAATNPATISATSTTHVNGQPDVSFEPATFKTKAQLRSTFSAGGQLDTTWSRTTYKVDSTSLDTSKANLNAASYASGSCSAVACHNGNSVSWTDTTVDCMSCHTELP